MKSLRYKRKSRSKRIPRSKNRNIPVQNQELYNQLSRHIGVRCICEIKFKNGKVVSGTFGDYDYFYEYANKNNKNKLKKFKKGMYGINIYGIYYLAYPKDIEYFRICVR